MSSGMDMSDLLGLFLEEAEEQLLKLDDGFLQLENDPTNIELLKEVFRAAHTLKGSSATMGLTEIADLTHAMENLLDLLRGGALPVTGEGIDLLLEGTDVLRTLVGQVSRGERMNADADHLLAGLEAICSCESVEAAIPAKTHNHASPVNVPWKGMALKLKISDSCLMPPVRAFMIYHALTGLGKVVSASPSQDEIDDLQAGQTIEMVFEPNEDAGESGVLDAIAGLAEVRLTGYESVSDDAAPPAVSASEGLGQVSMPESAESMARAIQTVRVSVDRLDTLMNLVAELVIDRTRMNQIGGELSLKYGSDELCRSLAETEAHIGRVVSELQEHIMKVRLLPVEQVFNRFPRMVRDLSHKAGKDIEFVLEGQETELDRSILEDIVDPLTHLLRNAVDHGIETPEERRAAGKPAKARIVLAASQEENRIIIEVRDDGRGISFERVKAAAVKKGAVSQKLVSLMTDEEALQLIFASGVSTAEKVTDLSGRGVGMDVVRNNIQSLSGNVEVHTELGKGTAFRVNLPLTLAIIQALAVGVEDRVYCVPLSAVVETFRCRADEMHLIGGRPAINFRGSILHLVRLGGLFACGENGQAGEQWGDDSGWITFVVVHAGGLRIGLVVDRLIGEQEVVIKPLGAFFGDIDGVAGATILGDGRVALIVDVGSIGALLNRRRLDRAA